MICQRCESDRILNVIGKVDDRCNVTFGGNTLCDYVPRNMGIGGGDYLKFDLCLDCGQQQGVFPIMGFYS